MLNKAAKLKAKLLTEGCNVDIVSLANKTFNRRSIHLYPNAIDDSPDKCYPEDIILYKDSSKSVISQVRYNKSSSLSLTSREESLILRDTETEQEWACSSVAPLKNSDPSEESIGKLLGGDLIGIIPSNYCFYFSQKKQCGFCELQPSYESHVQYKKPLKKLEDIAGFLERTLSANRCVKYLAVTTGNIVSYDATLRHCIKIGNQINPILKSHGIKDVLATLMPPHDLRLLTNLKESGYTKVYFPIEVYDRSKFLKICPGKSDFGYQRIIEALSSATEIFGVGNVYTNMVYGVQSFEADKPIDLEEENKIALEAVDFFLEQNLIPAFTVYHYGGFNQIGPRHLETKKVIEFFEEWGKRVFRAGIVPHDQDSVLFSSTSLSNTLFNDFFNVAQRASESSEREKFRA